MDDRLHKALAAIAAATARPTAPRGGRGWTPPRGAVEHLVREHSDAARRVRVAVWADVLRSGR